MTSLLFGAEDPEPKKTEPESDAVREARAHAADDLLSRIEQLQNDGNYNWASSTLEGIYETVEKTGRVTPGQLKAIDNIERAGQEREARPRTRRIR